MAAAGAAGADGELPAQRQDGPETLSRTTTTRDDQGAGTGGGGAVIAAERPRGQLWRAPRQMAGRMSWGLVDQAVSSLTNAAVGLYVVRTLGVLQFGAFSLAFVTYGFALNASRGLATDPLMVRFSGTDLQTWRRAVRDCTGTAALVGLVTGAIVIGAAGALSGSTRMAFLALGLTLPGLMLQDSWRYAFFALGRGSQALLNDLVWAVTLALGMVIVRKTGHANVFYYLLAWGASATVAASFGPVQSQVVPRLRGSWTWLSQHRDLGLRYMMEGTVGSLSTQLRTYGVGIILGLTAVAYMGAATTVMGPMTILFMGMALVILPEAARILKRSPRHLPLFCMLSSAGMLAAALAWGAVLLIGLPRGLGSSTIGPIWRPSYPLILPQILYIIGLAINSGAGTGLHALGAARRSLRMNLIGAVAFVALSLAGAVEGGLLWSMRGAAAAAWIAGLVGWWQFRLALRDHRAPADRAPARRRPGRHHRPELARAGDAALVAGPSIGGALADARRRGRLTVGQVSQRTGIEASIITQIERDDYSACGGAFYARVYIRSIARVVGTDSVPLIAQFDGHPPELDAADDLVLGTNTLALILPTEHSAAGKPSSSLRTRGWSKMWWAPITVLAILAAAAAVAIHGVGAQRHGHGQVTRHSTRPVVHASAPPAVQLTPVGVTAFGPGGPRHGDHLRTAALAIDGNPATAWTTNWYATSKFGNLKAGTGLLLDLGVPRTVSGVQITIANVPGAVLQVRAGGRPTLSALPVVARSSRAEGLVQLRIAPVVTARYVLIWFTRLPRDTAGTFRAVVYEIELSGRS